VGKWFINIKGKEVGWDFWKFWLEVMNFYIGMGEFGGVGVVLDVGSIGMSRNFYVLRVPGSGDLGLIFRKYFLNF
jgi:hypothetical protein